ncbi:ribbon-helix-helix protein, CopG family [Candidatus Micrarchaeota archaeon]|nr:ribbon-helix-helix protein, CopG family [Candidatus Micrarchaeota archaeon]
MEIVSVSLDKTTLDELNKTQEQLGFKSRSKLIRATINSLLNEYKVFEELKGHCDAVFTITHNQHEGSELSRVMKQFEGVIRTEIHQHHAGTCLRVLIACGDAEMLHRLFSLLKKSKGVRSVKCSML